MNDTDLIIGVELLEDNIQMCVYDSELKAPVVADTEDRKRTRLNSSHRLESRMPSSA